VAVLEKIMKTPTINPIDAYIESFPEPVQERLRKIRDLVRSAAPEAEETIKYRIPTFVLGQNLVHFAAFKNHIGFYPTSSPIRAMSAELANYPHAKGSIQFLLDRPLPLGLIKKLVRLRVQEARAKLAAKKARASKRR
jgi:uncharacterized protein YdhG (YjbR/CyaY superfamily)